MPSVAYIKAAKQVNRPPVVVAAIETVDATTVAVNTSAEWAAGNLTDLIVGSGEVTPETDGPDGLRGDYLVTESGTWETSSTPQRLSAPAMPQTTDYAATSDDRVRGVTVPFVAGSLFIDIELSEGGDPEGWQLYYPKNLTVTLLGKLDGGAAQELATQNFATNIGQLLSIAAADLDLGDWEFALRMDSWSGIQTGPHSDTELLTTELLSFTEHHDTRLPVYTTPASFVTPWLDLGSTPGVDPLFLADDQVPLGATLAYTVEGSTDAVTPVSLGAKTDGATLSAYRYYRITGSFTSLDDAAATCRRVGVLGGDAAFYNISTHLDEPVSGARPHIKANGIGSISGKIDLDKPASTGEISLKLPWIKSTGDLIASGFMKNKTVRILHGFVGLPFADYEPFATLIWHDYGIDYGNARPPVRVDAVLGEITVKLRDPLKRFEKIKLPEATFNAGTGANETTALTYTNANIFDVMADLLDRAGLPGRYIDATTFAALKALSYDAHHPAAMTVNTGTLSSGTYADLAAQDATRVEVTGVTETPEFDVELDFAGVTIVPAQLVIYGSYQGNMAHTVEVRAWNYDTSSYDVLGTLPEEVSDSEHVYGGLTLDHVSSGAMKVQIYHTSSGAAGHMLYLDHVHIDADVVTRTIAKPTDVRKLLGDLQVLSRSFLYPLPDGRITVKQYDSSEAAVATLDCGEISVDSIDADQDELTTVQVLYHDANTADPGDDPDDYDKGYRLVNGTVIAATGEDREQVWYDKWGAQPAQVEALAAHRDALQATPPLRLKLSKVPARYMALRRGQVMALDNLYLPAESDDWPGLVNGKKFLIVRDNFDPMKAMLSLELMELI